MSNKTHANVLLFSGLDPTGGAGIQADIETITSLGAKPCSIITALTVQDTSAVHSVINIDSDVINQQARCLLNDIPIQCIKLGMIADEKIIRVIAAIIRDNPKISVVLDPIWSAGGGGALSNSSAYELLISELVPHATIITPNSLEARQLASGIQNLTKCAEYLLSTGCQSVLITGSHEHTHDVCNTLYKDNKIISKSWPRLPNNYHGSGCTLSSSIAAFLALDQDLESAVTNAQQYTYNTLLNATQIGLGQLIPNRFFSPGRKDR